jgi:flagellar biosynthesis GTPase FlhF
MYTQTFTAQSMKQALSLIRNKMGADAIIMNTLMRPGGGVQVTAGLKQFVFDGKSSHDDNSDNNRDDDTANDYPELMATQPSSLPLSSDIVPALKAPKEKTAHPSSNKKMNAEEFLKFHRLPMEFLTPLKDEMQHGMNASNAMARIIPSHNNWIASLDAIKPIIFIGPAGSGKTAAMAKLAATLIANGESVCGISLDVHKAGSMEQSKTYFDAMECDIYFAQGPDEVLQIVREHYNSYILIDMPAFDPTTCPFECGLLSCMMDLIDMDVSLVIPATWDVMTAVETAMSFQRFKPESLIFSQMDLCKSYSTMAFTAFATDIPVACYGASRFLGDGLYPLNEQSIQQLFDEPEQERLMG